MSTQHSLIRLSIEGRRVARQCARLSERCPVTPSPDQDPMRAGTMHQSFKVPEGQLSASAFWLWEASLQDNRLPSLDDHLKFMCSEQKKIMLALGCPMGVPEGKLK